MRNIIDNPPKPWWPGDKRVEKYMVFVSKELDKLSISKAERTRVYNVVYVEIYKAIMDHSHK